MSTTKLRGAYFSCGCKLPINLQFIHLAKLNGFQLNTLRQQT